MRGIEAVVAIVLLLIMTVGLVAIVWMIFGPTMRQTSQTTGQQVKGTAAQHAKETVLETLKSRCEGRVGGHFIPQGLNSKISLDIANLPVIIYPNNITFNDTAFCVYRAGTEKDAPVVLAEANLSQLTEAAEGSKEVVIDWSVKIICPVEEPAIFYSSNDVTITCNYNGSAWNCDNDNVLSYDNETGILTYQLDNYIIKIPVKRINETKVKVTIKKGWNCAKTIE